MLCVRKSRKACHVFAYLGRIRKRPGIDRERLTYATIFSRKVFEFSLPLGGVLLGLLPLLLLHYRYDASSLQQETQASKQKCPLRWFRYRSKEQRRQIKTVNSSAIPQALMRSEAHSSWCNHVCNNFFQLLATMHVCWNLNLSHNPDNPGPHPLGLIMLEIQLFSDHHHMSACLF